jgi:hypothetical protein
MSERGGWQDVRDAQGDLLCKVDPERALVEVKPRGKHAHTVDLTKFGLKPAEGLDKQPKIGYKRDK